MTGDALLVSPVLHWNTQQAPAYFPPGRWYSLYDYSVVDAGAQGLNSTVHVRARLLPERPSAPLWVSCVMREGALPACACCAADTVCERQGQSRSLRCRAP